MMIIITSNLSKMENYNDDFKVTIVFYPPFFRLRNFSMFFIIKRIQSTRIYVYTSVLLDSNLFPGPFFLVHMSPKFWSFGNIRQDKGRYVTIYVCWMNEWGNEYLLTVKFLRVSSYFVMFFCFNPIVLIRSY